MQLLLLSIAIFLTSCATSPVQKEPVQSESKSAPEAPRTKYLPWPDKFLVRGDLILRGRMNQTCEYTFHFERRGDLYIISGADELSELPHTQDPQVFNASVRKITCLIPRFSINAANFAIVDVDPLESVSDIGNKVAYYFAAQKDSDGASEAFLYGTKMRIETNLMMVWWLLLPAPGMIDVKPGVEGEIQSPSGQGCLPIDDLVEETQSEEALQKFNSKAVHRGNEPAESLVHRIESKYCYSRQHHLHLTGSRAQWVNGVLTDDTIWEFVVRSVDIAPE